MLVEFKSVIYFVMSALFIQFTSRPLYYTLKDKHLDSFTDQTMTHGDYFLHFFYWFNSRAY